jgi:hypothetical protein
VEGLSHKQERAGERSHELNRESVLVWSSVYVDIVGYFVDMCAASGPVES